MREFIKFTFATFTGIVLAVVVFSILAIITVAGIVGSSDSEPSIKDNSIFVLNLKGDLNEQSNDDPLSKLMEDDYKTYGLNDILSSIEKAKENKSIKGIYLNPAFLNTSFASLEEIRNALLDFKKNGKFVISYADQYTQSMYYLASVADTLIANPMGTITWHGLSSQPIFYKDLLDKLGIKVQVFKVGTYKSAVEPYISNEMSPANREQVDVMLNSIWSRLLSDVSVSRKISADSLDSYANKIMELQPASEYLKYGLADKLMYKDQVISYLKSLTDCDESSNLRTVGLEDMINIKNSTPKDKSGNAIAVYYAEGEIGSGISSQEDINPKDMTADLRELYNDDNVKAVVLRVNSPGGSAYGSEQIWHEVAKLKEKKPVVVSMGNYAASGGYYISCPATRILADPTTITGSIGIFGMIPNFKGLLTDKIGLHFDVVKTNKFADIENFTKPLTNEESIAMQNYINNGYKLFIKRCADGRNMSTEDIEKIAQGRVWTGESALKLGLIDEIGGLNNAIRTAQKLAKVEGYTLLTYPKKENFIDQLINVKKDNYIEAKVNETLGEYKDAVSFLRKMKSMDRIQARLPFDLNIK